MAEIKERERKKGRVNNKYIVKPKKKTFPILLHLLREQ